MTARRQRNWTLAALVLLGASAFVSNTLLFQQVVQGKTDLTRGISTRIGSWELVDDAKASASEIQGLETVDIIKRTYYNGQDYMELVVAYIAHSSRKSAHAQEACLRGSGALVGSIEDLRMTQSPVLAKMISIDVRNRRQWVCYWYKIGGTYTAQYLKSSLLMFVGGLTGQKSQGASLIRLLTPERSGESRKQVEARMEDFTHYLIPELERTLP
jgi:EpsI family protein